MSKGSKNGQGNKPAPIVSPLGLGKRKIKINIIFVGV
jgi:hypothetical protein